MTVTAPAGAGLALAHHKTISGKPVLAGGGESHAEDFQSNLRKAIPEKPARSGRLSEASQSEARNEASSEAGAAELALQDPTSARAGAHWSAVLPIAVNEEQAAKVVGDGQTAAIHTGIALDLPLADEADAAGSQRSSVADEGTASVAGLVAGQADALIAAERQDATRVKQLPSWMKAAGQVTRLEGNPVPGIGPQRLPALLGQAAVSSAEGGGHVSLPVEGEGGIVAGIQLQDAVAVRIQDKHASQWTAALDRRVQDGAGYSAQAHTVEQQLRTPELAPAASAVAEKPLLARQISDVVARELDAMLMAGRPVSEEPAGVPGTTRRLTIDLMPGHLGQLRIELIRPASGELAITMTASSEQSAKLIQQQINELVETLKGGGVELGAVLVQAADQAAGPIRQASAFAPGQVLQDATSQSEQQQRGSQDHSARETADDTRLANGHRDDGSSADGSDGVYV
jgi:hypothetical protein